MKTARQRAKEFLGGLDLVFPGGSWFDLLDTLELSFKEYGRDQRHLCSEQAIEDVYGMGADAIQGAILNTKAPGEP